LTVSPRYFFGETNFTIGETGRALAIERGAGWFGKAGFTRVSPDLPFGETVKATPGAGYSHWSHQFHQLEIYPPYSFLCFRYKPRLARVPAISKNADFAPREKLGETAKPAT